MPRTTKPISTVTYNTIPFLNNLLDEYYHKGLIQYFMYIHHEPDVDDKKEHIHLFMVPSDPIDTTTFLKDTQEPDPNCPLPLSATWVEPSDFENWYLYAIHDKQYLDYKGLHKNVFYSQKDVVVSEFNNGYSSFYKRVSEIDMSKYTQMRDIVNAYDRKRKKSYIVRSGKFQLKDIPRVKMAWECLEDADYLS